MSETENHDPLQDKDAERAVLGALLMDEGVMPRIAPILGNTPDAFFTVDHQLIYSACLAAYNEKQTSDILVVADRLKDRGDLKRVGGTVYLYDLQARIVETVNTEYHAQIVADVWKRRRLLQVSTTIRELAHKHSNIGELQAQALDMVFDLTLQTSAKRQSRPISDSINDRLKQIEERSKNPQSTAGIPTGFTDFDIVTNGLQPGNFIVLAGRPGQGKTSLALNIAQNICFDQHLPIAIFSLEMTRDELDTRILASESQLSYADLRAGRVKDDHWEPLGNAAARIANDGQIIINDNRTLTLGGLKMEARHIKSRHENLALVIVDYIQLLHTDRDYQNREREVADVSRELKGLAYELECPVIGCSQLNRESEKSNKRPTPANLRDSGALEQDADVVAILHCAAEDKSSDPHIRELLVLKNRNGEEKDLELHFQPQYMTFTNLEVNNARTDISVVL